MAAFAAPSRSPFWDTCTRTDHFPGLASVAETRAVLCVCSPAPGEAARHASLALLALGVCRVRGRRPSGLAAWQPGAGGPDPPACSVRKVSVRRKAGERRPRGRPGAAVTLMRRHRTGPELRRGGRAAGRGPGAQNSRGERPGAKPGPGHPCRFRASSA